jgi:hypothetical protein
VGRVERARPGHFPAALIAPGQIDMQQDRISSWQTQTTPPSSQYDWKPRPILEVEVAAAYVRYTLPSARS